MTLTHVLKPIKIGQIEIKNRVFRSAHTTGFGEGIGQRLIDYHAARARGGVGLTVIEAATVHPSSPAPFPMPNLWPGNNNDEGYRRLIDACSVHDMKLFQQLYHVGASAAAPDGTPPWAPSDIAGVLTGVVPIPMSLAMIDEVVESFVNAAVQCEAVGLNGCEVHAAHGYLLAQFLSPNCNKRVDDYGGSFENRTRIVRRIVKGIRASVSSKFVVGIRMGNDLTKGGFNAEDYSRLACDLEEEGLIDYISLSLGNYNIIDKIFGGMHEPVGYEIPSNEAILTKTGVPSLVIGRFRTLEEADQVIRSGTADMVGMTRAHIADPDLVRKTIEGRELEVRPCIGCNQMCVANVAVGAPLACAVNVGAGVEAALGDDHLSVVRDCGSVVIVGGGPAGLEAARVAALRGHKVILFEARSALGGAARFASMAPTRQSIADFLVWLEQEVYRLGVDVRLNSYANEHDILAESPALVIVATGSTPRMDAVQSVAPGEPIIGFDQPHVVSSIELFEGAAITKGGAAVVIDDLGHYEAIAAAEHLISKGHSVTFVTTQALFGSKIEWALMSEPALRRMTPHGLKVLTRSRAIEITPTGVVVGPSFGEFSPNLHETLPAECVVFVSQNRPQLDNYEVLREAGVRIIAIGDALSPRFLQTAVREGHFAAAAA